MHDGGHEACGGGMERMSGDLLLCHYMYGRRTVRSLHWGVAIDTLGGACV